MMDRNYPTSSFADALVPPAQTAASWAYERGTAAALKSSSSYGAAHLDTDLLQRPGYVSAHQLPTYTTTPHPTGLPGVFDSSGHNSETSIMSFLSAMESRSLQAGPVSASLLPPFRTPSWPTGTNSSTTELYLTGALPSTATFPSPATLSSYQHTGAFPSRSYASTPSLTLQDPSSFSTSANGLFSHHDPLLHLKSSQAVLPAALAFNHLSAPTLGTTLPIQSSTYRSAQESAPHLLQPQFSLLSSPLPTPHSTPQPYAAPVFSGSIERALQRECSVIKHLQRPSSSHTAADQLTSSQHSLEGYLGAASGAEMSFQQDTSRHTPVSCSPPAVEDSSQGVGNAQQNKAESGTQAYSASSAAKAKDCSSKLTLHAPAGGEGHGHTQSLPGRSPESYSSPGQKQSSVIANHQPVELPSLLSTSLPQSYVASRTQSQTSPPHPDKLPSLYTTLPAFSTHSASINPTLLYSSSPGLSQEQEVQYGTHVHPLCQGNLTESYPSSHAQGAPNVTYSASQSQGQVSLSQSYVTGQSLNSPYPSTAGTHSMPTSNSTQGYTLMQSPVGGKTDDNQPQAQSQKYLMSAPLPSYSTAAAHSQSLQNNVRPSAQELKVIYGKHKLEELPIQDLQVSMETNTHSNMSAHNNVVYVVSKMEDRYKTQSVIRSNSREDHLMGLEPTSMVQVKEERLDSYHQQHIQLGSSQVTTDPKTTHSTIISSHLALNAEQLKQHSVLLKSPETLQQNHQNQSLDQGQNPETQTQFIRVPGSQVTLEHNQMIMLQQPLVHHTQNPAKVASPHMQSTQASGSVQVQYPHMDDEMLNSGITDAQSRQGAVLSEQSSGGTNSSKLIQPSKDHYSQAVNHQSHDAKNQFALNSICFPDSMLMVDDRNILSNVDDILAATVVACGVTPQDFVKATSAMEREMAVMANPIDSKGHFQTLDVRHMSPSFSTAQQPIIANTNSQTMAMTLNGGHATTDCQGHSVHTNSGCDLNPNIDGGISESDYQLASQVFDASGLQGSAKSKGIKREDGLIECQGSEGLPKKKARSRSLTKPGLPEEENGQGRLAKRCGPAKRQNSRGSDTGSSSSSTPSAPYDGYQQQERIRQKIREVEEKQPEVKTGFIGSFLDFLKSGPKQQYSPSPARTISRPRKPSSSSKPPTCPLPSLHSKPQLPPGPSMSQEGHGGSAQQHKHLDEDLHKNLETLPSFSSDEEENTGKNQALRNSISSALSALDEVSERRTRPDIRVPCSMMKPDQAPSMPQAISDTRVPQTTAPPKPVLTNTSSGEQRSLVQEGSKDSLLPGQLAIQLASVAIEGLTDEELSDSGGEGMYRERDEFVVRNEDIENLKLTMRAGQEPPSIWKVQKALLQKFVPELRDRKRVFSATNSYLGYFGDAKTMYQRVYVKFLDTVNKREYVRVCSRKPRCKPMSSLRGAQVKTLLGLSIAPCSVALGQKPRAKQPKPRAEPPPKKRRKWKEFSTTLSGSSAEDDEFTPPLPFSSRLLNTRTMKDTFRSFLELLVGVALDEDVLMALERENDELLLPHMRRVDGMIMDNRKHLLHKLHIGQLLKTALDSFPEISVVTELKKDGETPAFKVRLSGKAYNRKTMKPYKMPNKVPLEYTVDQQKTQWFSLYHSLQHYKYHTYLMCKDEIAALRVQAGQLGQDETVQKCLQNGAWVEGLFERFGELLNQVQQVCR